MTPSFTLRQLAYFAAAADTGSMTAASRREHVSQSAVSLAIAGLERELGAQLFIRHHAHGLTLTPAGRRVLDGARDLLTRAGDLADGARSLGEALTGTLAVACYDTIAPFLMPRLVTSFADHEPGVHLDLHEGDLDDVHALVRAGVTELMIAYDLDLGGDLDTTPLLPTRPYVLLPVEHRLAGGDEVALGDVAAEPFVLLDQPQPATYFLGLFESSGVEPTIGYRTSSFEMVRSLVARGLGYSLLIQRPANDTSYEGLPLTCLPLASTARTLTVVIATMRGAKQTRRARAFVEHCVDMLVAAPV